MLRFLVKLYNYQFSVIIDVSNNIFCSIDITFDVIKEKTQKKKIILESCMNNKATSFMDPVQKHLPVRTDKDIKYIEQNHFKGNKH